MFARGCRFGAFVCLLIAAGSTLFGAASTPRVLSTADQGGWTLRVEIDPASLTAGGALPSTVRALAVPDDATVRLFTTAAPAQRLAAPVDGDLGRTTQTEPVVLEEARFRGLRLVRVVFHPVRKDAAGDWWVHPLLEARLEIDGGSTFGKPRGGWSSSVGQRLRALLLNGGEALDSDEAPTTGETAPTAGAAGLQPAVKIRVDRDGLVRVAVSELSAVGFDPAGVPPDNLEVSYRGTALPSRVNGGGDGVLDPGDAVEFYAEPRPGRYANDVFYMLRELAVPGSRFPSRDAAPAGAATVPRFSHTEHYEEKNDLYTFGRPAEEGDPHFFWVWFEDNPNPPRVTTFTQTATLPGLDTTGSNAVMRAFFAGRTDDLGANPDHHVRFFVNNTQIGESQWNGQNFHTALMPFDASLLVPGDNDFRVDFVSIAFVDLYLMDWIEVDYPRLTVAVDDRITLGGESPSPARFDVTGVAGASDAVVLDVTDPLAPVELTGVAVSGAGPFTLSFQEASSADRRYHVAGDGGRIAAVELILDTPSDLLSPSNGADEIIIVPDGWEGALQGLVTHRQAQGTRVVLASITDVADEFAGGNVDDDAIRDFVAYAYANWQPPAVSYLLLVGEPNLDGRNDLEQAPYYNFMPTHYGVTAVQGETMTDTWFGAVSGADLLPDVAVGRFSVRSAADAQMLADKVVAYEAGWAQHGSWRNNVLQIASNESSFESSLEAAAALLPSHVTVDAEYRSNGANSGSIEDAFDAGAVLASLLGHGNVTFWADNPGGPFFQNGDAEDLLNADRIPLVTALNCLNGLIGHPFTVDSLAEAFHNQPDNGALGMWSPSSLGFLGEYDVLQQVFYRTLFQDRIPQIGTATNFALVETWLTAPVSIDLLKELVLLGDPAGWLSIDTDADDLPDAVEQQSGLADGDADGDDDGLTDGLEPAPLGDTDGDGRLDALDPDADNDALPDGLEAGVTAAGPGTDPAAGSFVGDLDPLTTTDPGNPDSDGGGAPDGVEDLDGNGRVDAGETDPEDPADDPSCALFAPPEIAANPVDLLALQRTGEDLLLTWGDASFVDPCLLYRVYAAEGLDASGGAGAFRLLGVTAVPQWLDRGGAAAGTDRRYLVAGFSLAEGEGPWGHFE